MTVGEDTYIVSLAIQQVVYTFNKSYNVSLAIQQVVYTFNSTT